MLALFISVVNLVEQVCIRTWPLFISIPSQVVRANVIVANLVVVPIYNDLKNQYAFKTYITTYLYT